MTIQRIPQPPAPNTRETRALALYRERHEEIERVGEDIYLVPSCSEASKGTYRVDYEAETCNCPDARRHPELNCKHVLCVGILYAKTSRRPKSGLPGRDDHIRILEDARAHPERTYYEHVAAAERIAAESYREDCRRLMRGSPASSNARGV